METADNSAEIINADNIEAFRKIQLRLLDSVDRICKKHDLKYWLDFGALLGAFRNGTFIPWDDDIDISMPEEDYKKFMAVAKEELPADMFLQTTDADPNFKQHLTKLRDNNSTYIQYNEEEPAGYHQGIFLDIFISVTYPALPRLLEKVLIRTTSRSRNNVIHKKPLRVLHISIFTLCRLAWVILSPLKKKRYGQHPHNNGSMQVVPLECLYPLTTVEFEGKNYPAPNDINGHLSYLYKNHMSPPPKHMRGGHARKILTNTPYNSSRTQ
jgi:lipopolysaccharide cholinephosphotransferase